MNEEKTLKDEIKMLNENFQELVQKKQAKKFRLPFRARVGKARAKQGYTSICYINENREIKFMKLPIQEGTVVIEGAPHLATTDFMLTYKNKPFIIIPAWNTKPFSPQDNYDEATKEKTTSVGYRLLLNTMKMEQIKAKRTLSIGVILIILAALGIGFYYLSSTGAI